MSQWAVAEFVSKVAERVSTAGEGFAAQLTRRHPGDWDNLGIESLDNAFPFVEPSREFVAALRAQLLETAAMVPPDVAIAPSRAVRRLLYGLAAVGSIASAAAIAIVLYRSKVNAQRQAA